jgi:hypothetical protein
VPAGIEDGAPIGPSRAASLPAFPAWSWVLFAAGAVAVGATAWLSLAEARASARVLEACRLAESGRIAEATTLYEASAAAKPVAPSDRGRFALALWEGGDLDGGDSLVEDLGPIDREVAGRLDAFLAKYEAAHTDLEDGRVALLDGKKESAWERSTAPSRSSRLSRTPPSRRAGTTPSSSSRAGSSARRSCPTISPRRRG